MAILPTPVCHSQRSESVHREPTHWPFPGPVYQTGSLMRSALVVHAYITQTAMDYHSSIMPLHGFVYTRALIFLLGAMLGIQSNQSFVFVDTSGSGVQASCGLFSQGTCHGAPYIQWLMQLLAHGCILQQTFYRPWRRGIL